MSDEILLPDDRLHIVMSDQEKKPWTFEPKQVLVTRKYLRTADYSILGMEDRIGIERKGLGDFVNTVIHDMIRFHKELRRLAGMDMACIVVEANLEQVLRKEYESEALPASVLGRANAIFVDYCIPVFWWGTPRQCADMAHRLLLMTWRKLGEH